MKDDITISKSLTAFSKAHKNIKKGTKIVATKGWLDRFAAEHPTTYLDDLHRYYKSFDDQHYVSLESLAVISEYIDGSRIFRFFTALAERDDVLVIKHMFVIDAKDVGVKIMSRKSADRSKTLDGTATRSRRR